MKKWIVVFLVLAMAGPSVSIGQGAKLSKGQIGELIHLAEVFTENTAKAGHDCIHQYATQYGATGMCNKFAAMTDRAYSLYFQMQSALSADPYQNARLIDPDGISAVEHNYHWIQQSERTMIDMGVFDHRRQ